jgi:hypothetical protein
MPNEHSNFQGLLSTSRRPIGSLGEEDKVEGKVNADAVDAYLKAASECIKAGKDCSKAQALESAALAAGIDPQLIATYKACKDDKNNDKCAKFGVTASATAACQAYTAGLGTAVCVGAVPTVVDALWPVIGPVANDIVLGIKSFVSGIGGAVKDIGEGLADMFGLDGGNGHNFNSSDAINVANAMAKEANKRLVEVQLGVVQAITPVVGQVRNRLGMDQGYQQTSAGLRTHEQAVWHFLNSALLTTPEYINDRVTVVWGTFWIPTAPKGSQFQKRMVRFESPGLGKFVSRGGKPENYIPTQVEWLMSEEEYKSLGFAADLTIASELLPIAMQNIIEQRALGIQKAVPKVIGAVTGAAVSQAGAAVSQAGSVPGSSSSSSNSSSNSSSDFGSWLVWSGLIAGVVYGGYKWNLHKKAYNWARKL